MVLILLGATERDPCLGELTPQHAGGRLGLANSLLRGLDLRSKVGIRLLVGPHQAAKAGDLRRLGSVRLDIGASVG